MLNKNKNGFEQINISDKLDRVVEDAIKRAELDKKKSKINLNSNERYIYYKVH